jgi:hypothetical protein
VTPRPTYILGLSLVKEVAEPVAERRYRESEEAGARPQHGYRDLRSDLIGALGEVALAIHLDVPYSPTFMGTRNRPEADVAGYEVRSTASGIRECPIRASDPESRVVVFAQVQKALVDYPPVPGAEEMLGYHVTLVGWITAGEGRRVGRAYGRAHLVPRSLLHPMASLP